MILEDVASAADAIEAAGGVPSARKIRDHLGRGNLTQIAALLRELNGQKNGQAEVLRLRHRVAELEAELEALRRLGPWAMDLYRRHVVASESNPNLLMHQPPPQPVRLIVAERT